MLKVIIIFLAVMVTVILLIFLFPIVKVVGDSMFPTFREGRLLVCRRLFNKKHCKQNKIYVVYLKDSEDGSPYYIIKRLHRTYQYNNATMYDFRGDNTRVSYDSRQHGLFSSESVVAQVIGNYKNKYETFKKGE